MTGWGERERERERERGSWTCRFLGIHTHTQPHPLINEQLCGWQHLATHGTPPAVVGSGSGTHLRIVRPLVEVKPQHNKMLKHMYIQQYMHTCTYSSTRIHVHTGCVLITRVHGILTAWKPTPGTAWHRSTADAYSVDLCVTTAWLQGHTLILSHVPVTINTATWTCVPLNSY